MADKNHIAILKSGVQTWNEWRRENPNIKPNLREIDISNQDLRGIDFVETNLLYANLSNSNLEGASIVSSSLGNANLKNVNLRNVSLINTSLRLANLSNANLNKTDFTESDLTQSILVECQINESSFYGANLFQADLRNSDLINSCFGRTILGQTNLKNVKNLEYCNHIEPSIIDHWTINMSGKLPLSFLRGCGLPDSIIVYYRKFTKQKKSFNRCFISYTEADNEIVEKLYFDLQDNGIRCWRWREDAKIGKTLMSSIDEAIKNYDKLIVICSENSLKSPAVLREIERALQKEDSYYWKGEVQEVLFPLTLDSYIFKKWEHHLKADLIKKYIGNLTGWKNTHSYRIAFEKLLKDLER